MRTYWRFIFAVCLLISGVCLIISGCHDKSSGSNKGQTTYKFSTTSWRAEASSEKHSELLWSEQPEGSNIYVTKVKAEGHCYLIFTLGYSTSHTPVACE